MNWKDRQGGAIRFKGDGGCFKVELDRVFIALHGGRLNSRDKWQKSLQTSWKECLTARLPQKDKLIWFSISELGQV